MSDAGHDKEVGQGGGMSVLLRLRLMTMLKKKQAEMLASTPLSHSLYTEKVVDYEECEGLGSMVSS